MDWYIILLAAVIPVVLLGVYVYKKDQHKEPKEILIKLFVAGMLSVIPIIIFELILGIFFPTEGEDISAIGMFINVFVSVALIEEGFKWIFTKTIGYNAKHFDEVYDVIVYAVFVSLGFACVENILYVLGDYFETGFSAGISVAIARGLLSIPGHACDGIVMGYFLSKAKLSSINGNKSLEGKFLLLSLMVPAVLHTTYDALLFIGTALSIIIFFVVHISEVIWGFIIVKKVSKMQQTISTNVLEGNIVTDKKGEVEVKTEEIVKNSDVNYCPMCGSPAKGNNYCTSCGFKLK